MRMTKLGGALLGAVFGVLAGATGVSAQNAAADYPNKPIRVIVPFAAGGGNDIFARLVGNKLSEILGQPVINENKPGAGGRIAAEYVMNQPHDGYTLFIGASGVMSIAAAAYPNLSYHPTKTFIPLSMIANFPLVLVVPPELPIKNVKELVEYAKKNPDKSNYASTSPAFTTASELLKLKSGMPGQMIPYKSSNEMILSVMQGQTLFAISDGPPAIPQIKAGKVKALAVTTTTRFAGLPDLPVVADFVPGYESSAIYGLAAPKATPSDVVATLNREVNAALADPKINARLTGDLGGTVLSLSPEAFTKLIADETEKWGRVIKATGMKAE
jgi:tripartite-type tricarboxylate transporter receptor subunit TctC